MEQQQSRPLDALNAARHKRVIVDLKNGKQFIGELKAFDIHINLVLEDAEQRHDGQTEKKMGKVFLRGDTIIAINVSEQ
jgi:small nuclear ribonucleoprotein